MRFKYIVNVQEVIYKNYKRFFEMLYKSKLAVYFIELNGIHSMIIINVNQLGTTTFTDIYVRLIVLVLTIRGTRRVQIQNLTKLIIVGPHLANP